MAVTVRRRKRRKNPSARKLKARAKKAAATRARKKAKRSAAAKRGWAKKRKARRNPSKKRRVSMRRRRRNPGTAAGARKARAKRVKVTGKRMRQAKITMKTGKKKGKRAAARAYIRTRSAVSRAKAGKFGKGGMDLVKFYGLQRVNPSLKSIVKDVKNAIPLLITATVAAVGASAAGMWLGGKLHNLLPAAAPAMIKRNVVPLSTFAFTLFVFGALKMSKQWQKHAAPVMLAGLAATGMQALVFSQTGQKIASKLGIPMTMMNPLATAEGAAAAAQGKAASGLGSYMTVSQYLGDYLQAGPQEAFGSYVGSDFPVHTPGPGDNMSVHASLGAYDEYEIGPGSSFYGRLGAYEDPALPQQDIDLVNTPGGTMIQSAETIGGLFDGPSAI